MRGSILCDVASIAECLQFIIEHPSNMGTVGEYEKRVTAILATLEKLPLPNTLAVAKELEAFRESVFRDLQRAQSLSSQPETQFASIAKTVKRAFLSEANSTAQ